jgi:hypothetical protein
MECKPGSIRYCDIPQGAEWSQTICDDRGRWGTCTASTIPAAAAAAGCSQSNYAPEICCPVAKLCCQDNPNGPFKDWGTGACAAISCP